MASKLNLKEKALLAGDDDAFTVVQSLGGKGIISASANVAPRFFVKMDGQIKKGDWQSAFQTQIKLSSLIRSLFLETNPAPVKYALSVMSHCENNLRLPLVPVTAETELQIRTSLKDLELL